MKTGQPHPDEIVESAALAAVEPPAVHCDDYMLLRVRTLQVEVPLWLRMRLLSSTLVGSV